jgi:transmembrane secretion effector
MLPLWRNRDFVLLQTGQLLSSAGTQATAIAYPLLVLATTGSPAKAGLVGFARLTPSVLLGLPTGALADRGNRRRLMIGADVLRGIALTALALALIAGDPPLGAILAVACVEGAGASVFGNAEPGVLRAVVPTAQMADAAGAQEVRRSAIWLAGPPLGGFLFGLGRAVPFVFDACSYIASSVALLAMRTPFQEEREADAAPLRARIAEGLRFLWGMPFLRICAALFALGNFLIPGMVLTLLVQARDQGLSAGATGLLLAIFGAGTLLGSVVSPVARRLLSVRAIVVMEQWTWLAFWAFVAWPDVYVLTAAMVLLGIAAPITNSVVFGLQIALTPDRLQGRVESVRTTIALALAPLGPLVAGALLSAASPRATVAAFACGGIALAVWGTLSPAIRRAPSLDELADVGAASSG